MAEKTGIDKLAYTLAAAYLIGIALPGLGNMASLVLAIVGFIALDNINPTKNENKQPNKSV